MTKLYGLVQAAGLCADWLGVTVGVRVNRAEKMDEIVARLPLGSRHREVCLVDRLYSFSFSPTRTTPGVRRFHVLYGNTQILARTGNETELIDEFASDMALHVAQSSPERVFVHAGVVSWKGLGIVIPGPSFTGKTTLIREFLRHGATYFSDEFAILDRWGDVHAFPRALNVRVARGGNPSQMLNLAEWYRVGREPVQVGLILLTKFKPGAQWRPRSGSAGRGALGLFANAISGRASPARALSYLGQAASGAKVLIGVRGEASDLVPRVLKTMETISRATGEKPAVER